MRSHRLEIEVEDPLGSAAGDQVLVTLPLGGLLGASALVYLLPAVLLLLGAVAGRFASPVLEGLGTDPGTLLGAGAGLLVGLGLARLADRRWGQTRRFRPHILARTSGDRPCHRPSPRQPDQEA
jgi:positive regulator of sigma E activity